MKNKPYRIAFYLFLTISISFFCPVNLLAQVQVQLTVLSGEATSTCRGGLTNPIWGLSIENNPEMLYSTENCPEYLTVPHLQYDTTLNCLSDLEGSEIELCFRAFDKESDGANPCDITNRGCEETICAQFLLPAPGNDSIYALQLPEGLSSEGFVNFRIEVSANTIMATNDRICNAIDLGNSSTGTIIGNASRGLFNNYCATNFGEPSPDETGEGWQNNAATWFSFTTSDKPNALLLVEAISDPENTDDSINLQLALYQSADNTCEGNLELIQQHYNPNDLNESMLLDCLEPEQQYFIMVDGATEDMATAFGVFGLQVRELSLSNDFSDDICDAIPLEVTSAGTTNSNFFNNCATNTGDPTISGFTSNNSVWFKFRPNQSRRVGILVESDAAYPAGADDIDIELAVFTTSSNQCTGNLIEVKSQYIEEDGNAEFLNLECLNPKANYWLMVDGSDKNPTGIFHVIIADRGYPAPVQLDTSICEGGILEIGNKTYANPGTYIDTIINADDCLEIIETNLSFVAPIKATRNLQRISSGPGNPDGIQIVSPSGGAGNYSIFWSNGQTNEVATGLVGGVDYCVTVADAAGCEWMDCFTMDYVVPIDAIIQNDTVDCAGDTEGAISFNLLSGQAPYEWSLRGINDPSFVLNGKLSRNDSTVILSDLPVGAYNITFLNEFTAKNFPVSVEAPLPLDIQVFSQENPTCPDLCNGALELSTSGGSGDYQYTWNQNLVGQENVLNLCAGEYFVTVADAKNCKDTLQINIEAPPEIAVNAVQVEAVGCFGQSNGQARVEADENLTSFLWDNGESTALATSLNAGIHQVTVTNENNCESVASVEITQSEVALEAKIELVQAIACNGANNGILKNISTGGNSNHQYMWSNGNTTPLIDNLAPGEYFLTVTDGNGCQSFSSIILENPTPIEADIITRDINCLNPSEGGLINVSQIAGGTPPYAYSLDGVIFTPNSSFNRLNEGAYDLIIKDANACEVNYETMIAAPANVQVTLGEDRQIKLGDIIDIQALTKRTVQYEWFSNDTLACTDCETISVQPRRNAVYKVKVTDLTTGCFAEDEIEVAVLKNRNVYVPNVFSPNGDGRNDELIILGGEDVEKVLDFKVFSRDGALIYEEADFDINDVSKAWDGTFNGERLKNGVFIYFAELLFIDGERIIFKGDFSLIR
jgi:gliding motility-associated-like protein